MKRLNLSFSMILFILVGFCFLNPSLHAKTLTVAIMSEPPHIDPTETIEPAHDFHFQIYRGLYRFDKDNTPVGDLVRSEDISGDGKTWTLKLQEGATFFDGTDVDASAVKYTIERMQDPKRAAPMATLFSKIEDVRIKDKYTVEIETEIPFASFRYNLAHPNTGIISPTADQKLKDSFGRSPVSCGAYMVDEWLTGQRIVLKRFEDYKGPGKPYYDKIIYRIVPSADTRMAMLETGGVDAAVHMPITMLKIAEADPNIDTIRFKGVRLFYFWFNQAHPVLQNIKVRQALNLAVNRNAIIEYVAQGGASPAHTLFNSGTIAYSINVGDLKYDPDKARDMLKEAGVLGKTIKILATEDRYPFDRQVAEAVSAYLRAVGMKTALTIIGETGAYRAAINKREEDMGMVGWAGSTGDPDQYLRRQLWGKIAGKPWNFANYRNPEVDALIEKGAQEFNQDERAKIYGKIQQIIWNDWPFMPLYLIDGFAYSRGITGTRVFVSSEVVSFVSAHPK